MSSARPTSHEHGSGMPAAHHSGYAAWYAHAPSGYVEAPAEHVALLDAVAQLYMP